MDHLLAVDVQPGASDLATFQTSTAHTCLHALDDDAPLKLCYRAHDHDDRPIKRSHGVYRLSLAEELDAHPVEFVNGLEQMFGAPRQAVARTEKINYKIVVYKRRELLVS